MAEDKAAIGEIYVFPFPLHTPDELRAHPENDMFMVYSGDGEPRLCAWLEGAFWYRWGETDADWEVAVNVEFWFRIPELKEIVNVEPQVESKKGV